LIHEGNPDDLTHKITSSPGVGKVGGESDRTGIVLISPESQRVRYPVNVAKPRRDERDLQDRFIVDPDSPKAIKCAGMDARGVLRHLGDIIEDRPILFVQIGRLVIGPDRIGKRVIQRGPTQKLCVTLNSVETPVQR
jgi:hypothetical protein